VIEKPYEQINVGDRNITRGRTITEADIVQFAMLSGDWQQLHTDAEYAAAGRFGQRIAHGMLVLSISTGLTPFVSPHTQALYGFDRLRFLKPTFIGDTIHVETEVTDKVDRGDAAGVVTWSHRIVNQRGEDVCVSEIKLLVARSA
jgi:acyl dehydratase